MPLRTAGEDDAEDRAELQGVQRARLPRVADGRIVDPYAAAGRFAQAALRSKLDWILAVRSGISRPTTGRETFSIPTNGYRG